MSQEDRVIGFAHATTLRDMPDHVAALGRRCLLDLIGVAAAGSQTELSRIVGQHVVDHFGAGRISAPLLFDGRQASPAGAALAGGMTIDAVDAHDGHRLTKGHAGCGLLPALLAFSAAEARNDGDDFLATLIVGYELATRAGIALHATAPDYHTSGAWIAVADALVGSRILGLDTTRSAEAVGIAEYHGPRSQMMRCIDHPTMLKDGSGWGAMAGVSAAYLGADGFTGAPALTVTDPAVAHVWDDLGTRWLIADQYFKPYPVCRWAQPAVDAALRLTQSHQLEADDIRRVKVETFHEAARLGVRHPTTTEQAQYSLPFPIAAAIVRGQLGPGEITAGLGDPAIAEMADRVEIVEDDGHNAAFPAERFARVTLVLADGREVASADTEARGDPHQPLTDAEIQAKFGAYATAVLGAERSRAISVAVESLGTGAPLSNLTALL